MSTNTDLTQAEMYEAFIGPAKAGYYVPIFERFDSGAGAITWNWPAAFITQLWMLYRGMFLWGFLWYPILSFIASFLVMLPFMAVADDSGQALSYLVLLPTSVIVMGLFSNKIFHGHVRKMIDKSGRLGLSAQQRREWLIRKGASNFVFVFIMIMAIVAIIGILAAIAIPAYQDYTIRAKVADGLSRTEAIKATYIDYVTKNQEWPASMSNLGLPESGAEYGPSVASVTIGVEHEIRITFGERVITGKTIILVPSIENNSLVWSCNAETLPAKYAPAACRH